MHNRPPRPASVLIVDDDISTANSLESVLQNAGLDPRWAAPADQWLTMVESASLDVIVLKLGRWEAGATQICRRVREATTAPLLLVGAQADCRDVIQGLEAGADAHVPPPCNPELTLAYVRALLRRRRLDKMTEERVLRIRDLRLDLDRCEAVLRDRRLTLTPTEFRLLWSLAASAGRVVSSPQLLEMAQGYRCGDQEAQEIVKVHVGHLRNKLAVPSGEAPYILTVRGFGYMLERRVGARSGQAALKVEGVQTDEDQVPAVPLRPFRRTRRVGTSAEEKKFAVPTLARS
ncbi:MAG: response regulator transcription factor [Chloroflexota bacterium]|nr:MAG: response regulator transcription factor [Chloroflexota bacterium]